MGLWTKRVTALKNGSVDKDSDFYFRQRSSIFKGCRLDLKLASTLFRLHRKIKYPKAREKILKLYVITPDSPLHNCRNNQLLQYDFRIPKHSKTSPLLNATCMTTQFPPQFLEILGTFSKLGTQEITYGL